MRGTRAPGLFRMGLLLGGTAAVALAADAPSGGLPAFPYGAVYFRKSNPPPEDWERDYRQAAQDSMNTFRHWFMWGAIEVAPGRFDWADYDRQLELSAKYGIKSIIAEIAHSAPEWAFRTHAHARYQREDGSRIDSQVSDSAATKGFPGLCLDNDDARELAGRFLTELATRYKNHPGLGGYNIWNECNLYSGAVYYCHCPGTQRKFREWLQRKYGTLDALNRAWRSYSYTDWDEIVAPPEKTIGTAGSMYPHYFDWVDFRRDNAVRLFEWRVGIVRRIDPHHPITAHGVNEMHLRRTVAAADDGWRFARATDIFGYTGGGAGNDRIDLNWVKWRDVDLARSTALGRPFWAAELAAGPTWRAGANVGVSRERGRIPTGRDVRLHNLIAIAGGATGIMSSRWRPLLDGATFGCWGYYDMDGTPTDRSAAGGRIARWANDPHQAALLRARPVAGDIGIVVVPESQIQNTLHKGTADYYADSVNGAYRAFLEQNIQVDFVTVDQLADYNLLYLPYPLMLTADTAAKLRTWVAQGGTLVSEAAPAYFGDGGHAAQIQPGGGLDEVFGVRQDYIEFLPDLNTTTTFDTTGTKGVGGSLYRQAYRPTTGTATGWFDDGRIAMVDNRHDRGRTRLIGSFPGHGYWMRPAAATRAFYAQLLEWAGKQPGIRIEGDYIVARLHTGDDGLFVYCLNHFDEPRTATLRFSEQWGPFAGAEVLWGENQPEVSGHEVKVTVPAADALILRLLRPAEPKP